MKKESDRTQRKQFYNNRWRFNASLMAMKRTTREKSKREIEDLNTA